MRAIVYTRYGSPAVLQLKEVMKPIPKDDGVLIRVYATTVNRTDCGFLRAEPFIVRFYSGLMRPKQQILGDEFAGKVEEIGKRVTEFEVGDRVFGYSNDFGAHADFITMPEQGPLAKTPAGVSYEEAAPSTEGAHYALNDIRAARVRRGQNVLINGATGAIGSAAVQIVKYLGASVTAVCDTKNIELIRTLGANKVIDYTAEDFTRLADTFDFVFDAVGKSSFWRCRSLLKPSGVYISTDLGFMAQNPFLALATPMAGGKRVLFPIPKIRKQDVIFFKGLIEAGKFKPVIDKTFPVERIAEAYRYVEKGYKTGNLVIELAQADESQDQPPGQVSAPRVTGS